MVYLILELNMGAALSVFFPLYQLGRGRFGKRSFPNPPSERFPGMLILKHIAGSFVNKPKRLNLFVVSRIREEGAKQTHGYQQLCYQ